MLKVSMVLVGPHAGKTISYNRGRYQFENGRCVLQSPDPKQIGTAVRVLGTYYSAYPEGSTDLEQAQKRWSDAQTEAPAADEDDPPDEDGGPDGDSDVHDEGDRPSRPRRPTNLEEALAALDHTNEDHWTAAGEPNCQVLGKMLGRPVSRANVKEAAPDLVRRPPQ